MSTDNIKGTLDASMFYTSDAGERTQRPPKVGTNRGQPWNRVGSSLGDVVALFAPMLFFWELDFGGWLYFPEVVLIAILPFLLLARGTHLLAPLPRTVILLCLIWLAGQVATDVVRGVPFEDYSRGWAAIGVFIIIFSSLYLLVYRNSRRLILYAAGSVVGEFLSVFDPHLEAFIGDGGFESVLKFCWATPLVQAATLLCLVPAIHKRLVIKQMLLLGSGAFLLLEGTRGVGAMAILTAISLFGRRKAEAPLSIRKNGWIASIRAIILILIGITAASQFYTYAATHGFLSSEQTQKYQDETKAPGGILLSGRSEFLVSSVAIYDSPWLGHGSWAKDTSYTALYRLLKTRYHFDNDPSQIGLIPAHSELFQSWVWAGVLAVPFWIWLMVLAIRVLFRFIDSPNPFTPYIIFTAQTCIWSIFFSPFASQERLWNVLDLVIFVYCIDLLTKKPYFFGSNRS